MQTFIIDERKTLNRIRWLDTILQVRLDSENNQNKPNDYSLGVAFRNTGRDIPCVKRGKLQDLKLVLN